ncbi:MAG: flagellar basal-body rod protein FlgG [Novosphingobium sp.]|nr:flagellar basal-body rod protein FlgG [Novosphingobium sp.]
MPISALHVARTGLDAQDVRMRVIANNLANVSTTGFKRDRANFATLAYQDNRVAGQQSSAETAYATGFNLGTGVAVQSTSRIETQGTLSTTGNSLDLALDGDGYFQVQLPDGQLGYTRAGNFSRSPDGQLVTAQGYPVQPSITIPEGATAISISENGTVSVTIAGESEATEIGQITIASFANPAGLRAISDNFLLETGASGAAQIGIAGEGGRGHIRQGMLEGSNVSIVEELVDMIETQRAYEINAKMVSAVDEMLRNANQTLGR